MQAATGAQGQSRSCGRTDGEKAPHLGSEGDQKAGSLEHLGASQIRSFLWGCLGPETTGICPHPAGEATFQALRTYRTLLCASASRACCSHWGRTRAASPVLSYGVTRPGTWLGLHRRLTFGCQNLTRPSKFQNCPAAPAGCQCPAPPAGAGNGGRVRSRRPASPLLPGAFALWVLPRNCMCVFQAPLPGPFPSAGWPVLAISEAVFGLWLTGDQQNKIYHLTALVFLFFFFFPSFSSPPPPQE